jgi:hypothetical protein
MQTTRKCTADHNIDAHRHGFQQKQFHAGREELPNKRLGCVSKDALFSVVSRAVKRLPKEGKGRREKGKETGEKNLRFASA